MQRVLGDGVRFASGRFQRAREIQVALTPAARRGIERERELQVS